MPNNEVIVKVNASLASYTFTFNGSNCAPDIKLKETYDVGERIEFIISPSSSDYHLPNKESVGVEGLTDFDYSINAATAYFSCTMPNNRVVVDVYAGINFNKFTFNGGHCDLDRELKPEYGVGEKVEFTITPSKNYVLPNEIEVEGLTDFTYSLNDDGTAYFSCTMPNKEVIVKINASLASNTFTFNGSHCNLDRTLKEKYEVGEKVEFYIISSSPSDYVLPKKEKINVTGLTVFTYTLTGGVAYFYCYMPNNKVVVNVDAIALHSFTFNGDDCKLDGTLKEKYEVGETVAFDIIPDNHYVLPNKEGVEVDGLTDFTYSLNAGVAHFSCTMPDKEVIVKVNASIAPSSNYLCFTSNSNSEVTLKILSEGSPNPTQFEYSLDRDAWSDVPSNGIIYTFNSEGESIYLRGDNPNGLSTGPNSFVYFCTEQNEGVDFSISGNIMSLISSNNFVNCLEIPCGYCFCRLFEGFDVTDASELLLPATTLKRDCYDGTFNKCEKLLYAPTLPATTLASCCYCYMFQGCSSLTQAPNLPATNLAVGCYEYMFQNCENLKIVSELNATNLTDSCYYRMFDSCTSLETAPSTLPATTLAVNCYEKMFFDCTKLVTPPIISAKSIPTQPFTTRCLGNMFNGCTALKINNVGTGTEFFECLDSFSNYDIGDMFTGTGGDFTGTPTPGIYYYS